MAILARVRLALVAITSSYITLGIFSGADAQRLWAPYAAVMFVLALLNLCDSHDRQRRGR